MKTDLGGAIGVGGAERGRGEERHAHHRTVRPCGIVYRL